MYLLGFMGGYELVTLMIFGLPFLLVLISWWKIYEKSGHPGWSCLIPIYNILVFLKIIGKPWYWLILFCIPYVNLVFGIWGTNLLSKRFGKDEGFTVGLILLPFIFLPILGFGISTYSR